MLFTYIRFPQFVEDPCTPKKHFDLKQWFLSLFNHANKRQFAYQIVSILWKGTLLEGCIGSRRFASIILKLLLVDEGMILMAWQGWKLWGVAGIYPFICHDHLLRMVFCISMNGVFPNVCRSCGMFNGFSASDASIMNSPQSSLISRMPNSELDRRDLVWNCESCTFENEVFVPVCEICGAPNLMFD
ncbi:uncharacterized protein LOC131073227 isoform X2 [Cryptomeria japonica]|nr:uncharacterized protein LOC131073227 isoform X2 [Cryptomeria japonica]